MAVVDGEVMLDFTAKSYTFFGFSIIFSSVNKIAVIFFLFMQLGKTDRECSVASRRAAVVS